MGGKETRPPGGGGPASASDSDNRQHRCSTECRRGDKPQGREGGEEFGGGGAPFPELWDEAFIGPLGSYALDLDRGVHTEAHRQGVLLDCLVRFGVVAGRDRFARVGATEHPPMLFGALLGPTASGGKGEASSQGRALFEAAGGYQGARVVSSVGSGQGLIEMLSRPEEEGEAEGVRLMVEAREMASILAGARREASTLSPVLREGWDAYQLDSGTKSETAVTAEGYTLGALFHSTPEEFRSRTTGEDATNGLLNRVLFCPVRRTRLIPRPRPLPPEAMERHASAVRDALYRARSGEGEVRMSAEAEPAWDDLYRELATPRGGIVGALTARVAPQALRVSLLYALTMRSEAIEPEHIRAARAWVRLHIEAARWIFGDRLEDHYAEKIREALEERGDLSLDDLRAVVGTRKTEERDRALAELERLGIVERYTESTGGRSRTRYTLHGKHRKGVDRAYRVPCNRAEGSDGGVDPTPDPPSDDADADPDGYLEALLADLAGRPAADEGASP